MEVGHHRKAYWCVKEWPSETVEQVYESGMLVFLFCAPVAIMTCAYSSICVEMMSISKRRAVMRPVTDR
jgi:hypothetical protein